MTNSEGDDSIITNSAIHHCNGYCINAELADHVRIDNNVIFHGKRVHIFMQKTVDWTVTNNLFIGAYERPD